MALGSNGIDLKIVVSERRHRRRWLGPQGRLVLQVTAQRVAPIWAAFFRRDEAAVNIRHFAESFFLEFCS
jgi:hypothetical protein